MIDFDLANEWNHEFHNGATGVDAGDPADVLSNPDADFSPALKRILQTIRAAPALRAVRSARILLTSRVAFHFYSPIEIGCAVEIVGSGTSAYSGLSRMIFHGCAGLTVAVDQSGGALSVGALRMHGVSLSYVGSNVNDVDANGVTLYRTSHLENCQVLGFPGYGIYAEGQPGTTKNVDTSFFSQVVVQECGLTGIRITGGDANVIVTIGLNLIANGRKRISGKGYNLHDDCKLGGTHIAPHARNGHEANYCINRGPGNAPSRTLITGAYSEHGPVSIPDNDQPGPDILEGNALVITAMGEGSLADAIRNGATVISTSINRLLINDVVQVGGVNGVKQISGDGTKRSPGDVLPRPAVMYESNAYSESLLDRFYAVVHDPVEHLWAAKTLSPQSHPSASGITDGKHARGTGIFAVPRGLLLGTTGLLVGTHDPRFEKVSETPPVVTAAASLAGKYPLTSAQVGDVVLNALPDAVSFNWTGWICTREPNGEKAWRRYGVGQIGAVV